jgi:hypothetical protein
MPNTPRQRVRTQPQSEQQPTDQRVPVRWYLAWLYVLDRVTERVPRLKILWGALGLAIPVIFIWTLRIPLWYAALGLLLFFVVIYLLLIFLPAAAIPQRSWSKTILAHGFMWVIALSVGAVIISVASAVCSGHPEAMARLLRLPKEVPVAPPEQAAPEPGKAEQAQKDKNGEGVLQLKYGDPKVVFDDTSPGFTLQRSLKTIAPLLTEPDKIFQDDVQPFTNKPIVGEWRGTLEELGPRPKSPKEARKLVLRFGNTLKAACFLKPGRSGDELETLELGVDAVTLTGGIIARTYRESRIDPADFVPKRTAVFHLLNCEHAAL